MNVLIVEDSASARKLLRYTFEHYGCTVIEAQDGQEGLDRAALHMPDIIISDALMPRMDGFQLLRALKTDPALKSIPFIFYSSAYTGDKETELALSLGAEAFVTKPVEPEQLWKITCAIMKEFDACPGKPAHAAAEESNEQYLREYSQIVASKLEQKVKELEQLNENLEQRVQERTAELNRRNAEIQQAYDDLKRVQAQLLQQDKMASVGQLAAGVAHEINNPMGFIISNLGSLGKYVEKLAAYLDADEKVLAGCEPAIREMAAQERQKYKIDRIRRDMPELISESSDGAERVRQIVQHLKNFSRVDGTEFACSDINDGLESTLSIAWNELKYKAAVTKEYGQLPKVWCNMGQLNQVFLNILVNAAHAIKDHGDIRITTWEEDNSVRIAISDTGCGIPPENLKRIFDPFFTTKEVGKGTGLGLAIAYDIVNKHGGSIDVISEAGNGTTFSILLPVKKEQVVKAPD
ncbi:MAG: ATP-binding protein [Deltaproteobacteria bacterium]|nr:ATP-binding protein [Deltaproteobacteria bacterium]